MSSINQHIENYLDFYLKPDPPKNYAILLDGEWGAGKTHFIKNFCAHPSREQKKFIYISLYGVSKSSEIDDQIFQQVHPRLASKPATILTKVAKAGIQLVGISDDETLKIKLTDFFDLPKELVLIFDDLERCSMSIEKALGYINYFCEHQDHRIIVIANEKEIKKSKKYHEIKEKLIGRSFTINASANEALDVFIDLIQDSSTKVFSQKNRLLILEIYKASGYNNLRSLKQAIIEWPQFFTHLPEKAQKNEELLKDVFRNLLIFSFEIRKGKLTLEEIKSISSLSYAYALNKKKDEPNPYKEIEQKYTGFFFNQICPSDYCWYLFFKEGSLSQEAIEKSIDSSRFFINDNKPDWHKLLYFNELGDADFNKLKDQVWNNFESGEYKKFGEIKHVVSTYLFFSKQNMISKTSAKIISDTKKIIGKMEKAESLQYEKTTDFGFHDAYAGVIFLSNGDSEFKKVVSFLTDIEKRKEVSTYPEIARLLVQIVGINGQAFWEALSRKAIESRYHDVPVLKYIAAKEFTSAFLQCPNEQKRYISYGFKDRYQFVASYKRLLEEHDWLKSVKKLLLRELKAATPLTRYHINWFFQHSLNPVLKTMAELQKSQNS